MREVFTPSELNREVRLYLEAGFPRLWVEGEISNLARPASGHLYFSLKDEKAQIRCALFRQHAQRLGFRPENGMLVQARGKLGLYEPRGEFQLIADTLEEAGEGRLRAAFDALKKKLESEGLFAAEAKQALPRLPVRIGVITSPSGAVIRDILHVLARRWPLAEVRLYPVPVQGADAPPAIVAALEAANRHAWAQALILGRGGGSLEDLWAFNQETVARAVFASALPVISAVGHEIDFSITDFVADVRAPTPSAAAELLTPDQAEIRRSFTAQLTQLQRRIQDRLARSAQQQDHLALRLAQQHPGRRLSAHGDWLAALRKRLHTGAARLVPDRRLLHQALQARLLAAGSRLVPERQRNLKSLARTLHAVSPLPTLERGYAVVTDAASGRIIQSRTEVRKGQHLIAQLRDGRIRSRVESTTPGTLENAD